LVRSLWFSQKERKKPVRVLLRYLAVSNNFAHCFNVPGLPVNCKRFTSAQKQIFINDNNFQGTFLRTQTLFKRPEIPYIFIGINTSSFRPRKVVFTCKFHDFIKFKSLDNYYFKNLEITANERDKITLDDGNSVQKPFSTLKILQKQQRPLKNFRYKLKKD
jgi:hypothetical protein